MKKVERLFAECKNHNLNCSITYQSINDISIEIYKGYKTNYIEIFYTDGHVPLKRAIKKAFKYLKNYK